MIKRLKSLGVDMEVCSAATAAYKIDNATILPEIKVVGSGFLSAWGGKLKVISWYLFTTKD